ncbi:ABC transporter permease [Edaphobacter aggregans]|uniref:ABC transporter permease n=1 Tax=Edaphobacter aggregans TaxID=570835 RepID=UPI0005597E3B|nr:ABC transporter permease [Edaphobacter aggregans]
MLKRWVVRLRLFLRRDAELDEEMPFHLEREAEQNIAAGMKPEEARRRARIAFGGVVRAKEECREARPGFWIEVLAQDVRYGLRGFRRSPVFTLTIVATLMLGIGATAAVFSVVDRILFRALPYADADRLVSVGLVQSMETQEFMLGHFYYDWRRDQTPFEAMTSENAVTRVCDVTEGSPAQLSCPIVEVNFLPTLGVTPVAGRNFLPEEGRPGGPNVALISYGLWLTRYNRDAGILNKTIEIDGKPVRVVGVLPKEFEMPRLQAADVIFPMTMDEAADRKTNSGLGGPKRVFARLRPGVSVEQAYAQLGPLFEQTQRWIPAEIRSNFRLKVRSLRDRQMQDVRLTAWVLLGTVLAVLLIACANVASLLMARGAARQRELAVRSALGASRGRLVRQALTEAGLLSLAGAVAGCALAQGLLRVFVAMAPASVPYITKVHLDLRIAGFTVLLSFVCGALFGLIPALQRPREELLTGRTPGSLSHAAIRQWLVVAQIAASVVLLTAATLMLRSFWKIENQQLGMREDNTVTARITLGEHKYSSAASKMMFFGQLATRLRFLPGVEAVSVSDSLPPDGAHAGVRYGEILIDGRPRTAEGPGSVVIARLVSPDYFRALDVPIVRGVGFQEKDLNSNERVVVISQRLAETLFPSEDPIGMRLNFEHVGDPKAPWYTVVGVAANVKNGGLTGEQTPEYYFLRRNRAEDWGRWGVWDQTSVFVVRSLLTEEETSKAIRAQVAALDSTLPVDIATLRQRVSKLADQPRFQATLVGFFAAIGLTLAVIGLYGVIAFLVAQRTQEIGVRMALGAARMDILRLVMGRSARLIVAGVVAGLVAALATSRVLSSLLFGVGPRDPVTFGAVTLLLIVVALAATLVPARSASRVDPAVALRSE